jgi:uncharacterized protein YndB with AHSA1/START domain
MNPAPEDPAARSLVVSREFVAPRELVWDAFADPSQVAQWWGPRGFSTKIEEMDFRVGGAWRQVMHGPDGTNYPNKSIFKEIAKPARVVYSHAGGREKGPGASFLSTWSFDDLGASRTRVTIHMMFSSVADREFVVKEFRAEEGGRQTLERLSEHLARTRCAPFVISREFAASRERVWRAWTERERLVQWFGPKGCSIPIARLDFRPGGEFHYCMLTAEGLEMWGKWIFRDIVPPERIVLANSFSNRDGELARPPFPGAWPLQMLTESTFVERSNKTTITLNWVPLDATGEECRTFDHARDSFRQGWSGTFDQLEGYLANTAAD